MSGHRIPPFKGGTTHFYSSTKFAVNAITEATRRELRELKTHIRVAVSIFTLIVVFLSDGLCIPIIVCCILTVDDMSWTCENRISRQIAGRYG